MLNSGLVKTYTNRSVPEILHINTDGSLPEIQVETNGNTSVIRFLICQKMSEDTDLPPQLSQNLTVPFTLLAPDKVC